MPSEQRPLSTLYTPVVRQQLEFLRFDEHPPREGVVVDLRIPNPDYAEELAGYQAALEFNPFAKNDVSETLAPRLTESPDALVAADELCVPIPELTLVVGYPFAGQYAVTIEASSPDGFTRADLFRQLVRAYSAMYEGATSAPTKHLYNTHVESPRFGEAWHVIDDLVVHDVLLQLRSDGRVFAWIYIGS